MSASSSRFGKRKRECPDDSTSCISSIDGLPYSIWAHVANFLPKPSLAMFAVALTAPSSSWMLNTSQEDDQVAWSRKKPSALGRTILAAATSLRGEHCDRHWAALDFEQIDKVVASKLSDFDVGAILICMDAVNTLQRLKLTGLVNITGDGLKPLAGSAVLQQVDLSLQKLNGSPKPLNSMKLSKDVVLPILASILDVRGNSLKHLFFPKEWKAGSASDNDPFLNLLNRYMELIEDRPFNCATCCDPSANCEGSLCDNELMEFYGIQYFTCCLCIRNFCDGGGKLYHCEECDKFYCSDCAPEDTCANCEELFCKGCNALEKCEECNKRYCSGCFHACDCCHKKECSPCAQTKDGSVTDLLFCDVDGCEKVNCAGCSDSKNVQVCSECQVLCCFDCLDNIYECALEHGEEFCSQCSVRVLSSTRAGTGE